MFSAFAKGDFQFAEQLLLAFSELDLRLDDDLTQQITDAAATDLGNAFAAQPENFAGLGFSRDLEFDAAIQSGHFEFTTQTASGMEIGTSQ